MNKCETVDDCVMAAFSSYFPSRPMCCTLTKAFFSAWWNLLAKDGGTRKCWWICHIVQLITLLMKNTVTCQEPWKCTKFACSCQSYFVEVGYYDCVHAYNHIPSFEMRMHIPIKCLHVF